MFVNTQTGAMLTEEHRLSLRYAWPRAGDSCPSLRISLIFTCVEPIIGHVAPVVQESERNGTESISSPHGSPRGENIRSALVAAIGPHRGTSGSLGNACLVRIDRADVRAAYDGALVSAICALQEFGALRGREAADRDGEWILDACAGSGAVARQLAETFPRAVIVCADISGRMLCEVRRRWRPGDGKRPYLVQADATRLPFRSDIFGVVFLQNAPPYVEEMVRVGLPRAAVALIYTFGAVVPERYETLIATKCKHAGLATVQVVRTGGGAYVIGEKEAK